MRYIEFHYWIETIWTLCFCCITFNSALLQEYFCLKRILSVGPKSSNCQFNETVICDNKLWTIKWHSKRCFLGQLTFLTYLQLGFEEKKGPNKSVENNREEDMVGRRNNEAPCEKSVAFHLIYKRYHRASIRAYQSIFLFGNWIEWTKTISTSQWQFQFDCSVVR